MFADFKKKKIGLNSESIPQQNVSTTGIPKLTSINSSFYLARVQTKLEKATIFVIFNKESKEFPPYRIENFTTCSITIAQKVKKKKQKFDGHKNE